MSLRVSATLYTTWLKCPAQAAARLEGHYPADTIAQFKGLLAHRIFARHLSKGHIAPSGFRQVCQEEIGSSNLNWKVRDLGLKPSEIRRVIDETADLYRRFILIKPAGTPEVHIEHTVSDELTLIGTIDAVQGNQDMPRLVDWKTGELGDASAQLRFYAMLWTLSGRPRPLSVEAVSVATGERHEEWIPNPPWREDDPLFKMLLEITEMVADLTTPGFTAPTEPGPWCRWCPILEDCAEGQAQQRLVELRG